MVVGATGEGEKFFKIFQRLFDVSTPEKASTNRFLAPVKMSKKSLLVFIAD